MNQDLLYCNRQGHSQEIIFICMKSECQLSSLCCNQCVSEIHQNHSNEDFIELESAIQQGKKLTDCYMKLFQSLKQTCKEYLKQIREIIEKYDIFKVKPTLTQLKSISKEIKTGNLEQKVNLIQDCLKEIENDITDSFLRIIQCFTQENPISIEENTTQIKQIIKYPKLKPYDLRYKLNIKQKGHGKTIKCLSISKNDELIASSGLDNKIILWKISGLNVIQEFQGINTITSLIFAPNNEILIAGEYDDIMLFKLNTNNFYPFKILKGHKYIITTFAITHDSRYLISGSWDKTIKIWNLEQFKMIDTHDYNDHISGIAISDNQKYLGCYGESDGLASLFDCTKIEKLTKLSSWEIPRNIKFMEFAPGSTSLLITGIGSVQIWNITSLLKDGTPKLIHKYNQFKIVQSKLSSNGSLLCCCDTSRLYIINYQDFKLIQSFHIELTLLPHLVLTSDLKSILTNSDKEIFQFEII